MHENAPSGSRVKDRRVKRVLTRFGEVEVRRRRCVDGSGTHRHPLGKLHDSGAVSAGTRQAARFKNKGQRWSPRGADAMARVLAASRMSQTTDVSAGRYRPHPP